MKHNRYEIFFTTTSYIKFHSREMIERIEEEMNDINFYCSEMIENAKKNDIKLFLVNLKEEISILRPKIILMFGDNVYDAIWKSKGFKKDIDDNLKFYYKNIDGIYYVLIKSPLKYNIFSDEIKEEYIRDLVLFLSNLLEEESQYEL